MTPIQIIADMVKRVLRKEKYYIPKFVDLFEQLPENFQEAMLKYIVEEVGSDKWKELLADPMHHRRLLTYILFNFTGNRLRGEPDKEELVNLLKLFLRSDTFKEAIYLEKVGPMIEELGSGTVK